MSVTGFGSNPESWRVSVSHTNKERSAEFAEKLFWSVLGHLQHASLDFAAGRKGNVIYAIVMGTPKGQQAIHWKQNTDSLVNDPKEEAATPAETNVYKLITR
jgi:hypothetical protein